MHLFSLFFFLYCCARNKTITLKTDVEQANLSPLMKQQQNSLKLKSTFKGRLSWHWKQCLKIGEYIRGNITRQSPGLAGAHSTTRHILTYSALAKTVVSTDIYRRKFAKHNFFKGKLKFYKRAAKQSSSWNISVPVRTQALWLYTRKKTECFQSAFKQIFFLDYITA